MMPVMTRRLVTVTAVALALVAVPAGAGAAVFGSSLRRPANVNWGCELAPVLGLTGFVLAQTGQRTCTWRSAGYFNTFRQASTVPGNGVITRIRVRAGRNPAPLRLTILTSSSRLYGGGGTLQNSFTCCTARRFSRTFRPRANRITTVTVNMRVFRTVDRRNLVQTSDVVGLSAVGRGTLPLRVGSDVGGYSTGNAISAYYYPLTRVGEPRVEGGSITGVEVLLRWEFRPARRR